MTSHPISFGTSLLYVQHPRHNSVKVWIQTLQWSGPLILIVCYILHLRLSPLGFHSILTLHLVSTCVLVVTKLAEFILLVSTWLAGSGLSALDSLFFSLKYWSQPWISAALFVSDSGLNSKYQLNYWCVYWLLFFTLGIDSLFQLAASWHAICTQFDSGLNSTQLMALTLTIIHTKFLPASTTCYEDTCVHIEHISTPF
jgi:hypothetical protein